MALGDGSFPKADIYDAAAEEILKEVAAGRRVAVLCEGDPFFYGSFIYLYARLAGRCPVAIVPGRLLPDGLRRRRPRRRWPLRNESLTVLPGPLPEAELRLRLGQCEAAAIIKVGRHLAKIRAVLRGAGADRPRPLCRARQPRHPAGAAAA